MEEDSVTLPLVLYGSVRISDALWAVGEDADAAGAVLGCGQATRSWSAGGPSDAQAGCLGVII
jgi:hypothetical protein